MWTELDTVLSRSNAAPVDDHHRVPKNSDGQTALHIALQNRAPFEVFQKLLKAFPAACHVRDQFRCHPLVVR